ncbi:dimethyl sulfone monooxygenase SfnG [Leptolyngbya sp. PL-A3]|nr:dimethyl sulfone monooxygenase SfnG [Leptolyngbya sp. FACHB-16]MBD2153810.1 dimethyl sulfone monooxygenase SfnG [Leptolyngbya sp. FACHB-16]
MDIGFGYWMPIISGGYVISTVPQRTEWGIDYNIRLAQTAESLGFDYTLAPARFMALEAGNGQHDAITSTALVAGATERIKIISAVHTGLWHPAMIAKMGNTIDIASKGRFAINILSGWLKEEFRHFNEPWLEHDERYRRSEEFIEVLKGLWTSEEPFYFSGDYYRINGAVFRPGPVSKPHPEIFQGGNSKAARRMAGRYSDWYFMNGNSVEGVKEQIEEISAIACEHGRTVRFGLNGFVIQRDTEAAARAELQRIIDHADVAMVQGFAEQAKNAGSSTREKVGMWANSNFADLVQPNDGFKTGLIGPTDLIVDRIRQYYEVGVDLMLCSFLHFTDELPEFGRTVIPKVRQLDVQRHSLAQVA